MDKFIIEGGSKLSGSVSICAAKNACLPIMAASLLFPFPAKFENLPELQDIKGMIKLLESLGVKVEGQNGKYSLDSSSIQKLEADYELVRKMRASILVLGPMLARFGQGVVSLPGGCAIGTRPIDIHLDGLKAMGAELKIDSGYVHAKCEKLKAVHHVLPFPSVGATENLMSAAVLAQGTTTLENVAREPEIVDLANFLNAHGAKIKGAGTAKLEIEGINIEDLKPSSPYKIIGDRIEAATYIMAALMTKSAMKIKDFTPSHLDSVFQKLKKMGAQFNFGDDYVEVIPSELDANVKVDTAPFPGFPTDVQAQMMALLTVTKGSSVITENIFENRFMHVPELVRMGAKISLRGSSAMIQGVEELNAAPVMCTDLRASAALVLAALVANGTTEVRRVYHIDRGYEKIDEKLSSLGVNIRREKE